ncbi:hypothetical protein L1987_76503 [Smallanthus sonchifolius]|uniref:Uncharacterized protein n=1 Tax=Smallanthus sonchifolius TaxID=185202 RepID=A0ACB8Z7V8_9ASTR|nr:hypothetical protein L1987_76503 [Smallanthus sonchifolius]
MPANDGAKKKDICRRGRWHGDGLMVSSKSSAFSFSAMERKLSEEGAVGGYGGGVGLLDEGEGGGAPIGGGESGGGSGGLDLLGKKGGGN